VIRYLPLVEKALRICENDGPPKDVLVLDRGIGEDAMRGLDHWFKNWKSEVDSVKRNGNYIFKPEEMKSTDPLYLIYTSGSTGTLSYLFVGTPKGIVRDCGGYTVALKFSMSDVFGVKPGDV
jgi:propionyl-CoA synthetase